MGPYGQDYMKNKFPAPRLEKTLGGTIILFLGRPYGIGALISDLPNHYLICLPMPSPIPKCGMMRWDILDASGTAKQHRPNMTWELVAHSHLEKDTCVMSI